MIFWLVKMISWNKKTTFLRKIFSWAKEKISYNKKKLFLRKKIFWLTKMILEKRKRYSYFLIEGDDFL